MRPFEHEKVLAFQKASKSGKLVGFNCFEECVIEKGEKSLCYPARLCKIKCRNMLQV